MGLRSAWLAVPFLAACASTVDWSKPGASQEQIDADLKACRTLAVQIPIVPRERTTAPSGAVSQSTGTDLNADRQLVVAQRTESCMRQRGYQLIRK